VNLSIVSGDCFANSGSFTFTLLRSGPAPEEQGAAPNPSEAPTTCSVGQPVNCATGTLWHSFTDVAVPGLGVPLNFSRTYSSADAVTDGPLGYGWTGSYGMRLDFGPSGEVDVVQENGSIVPFYEAIEGYVPGPGVQGSFVDNEDGTFTFTRFATNSSYVFDAAGKLLSEVDPNGYETSLSYDGTGRLTEVTDQAGRTLELAYDGEHISSLTDPKGHVISFGYDQGDLVQATDPRGNSWEFAYDSGHRLVAMTDPNGGTTTNVYDGSDRVVRQENPLDQATTWSYVGEPETASGGMTTITDPLGRETVQHYVDLELTEITVGSGGPDPATTSYEYDPISHQVTQATSPEGNVSTAEYDERGDLLEAVDPLGHARAYTYDPDGNLLSATDPRGATRTYSYDAGNNLVSATTPLGAGGSATWTYEYGTGASAGDLLAATNPDGRTTEYQYDEAGNVVKVVDPLGGSATYAYDANGNLTGSTDPSGRKTSYTYDAGDELTAIDFSDPATPDVGLAYDPNGNRTGMDDGTGECEYSFDAAGRMTSATNGAGRTIGYAYDDGGQLTEVTYPNGKTVTRGYDDRGQLASVTDWLGYTSAFEYDGDGNFVGRELPGSVTTTTSFDADGRVTKIDSSGEDGLLARFSYGRDESGQVISSAESGLFSGAAQYTYDEGNRLTSAGGNVYRYDDAGNPTAFPDGRPQSFDAAGQLLSSGAIPPQPEPTPDAAPAPTGGAGAATVAAVRSSHRLRAHRILSTRLSGIRKGELLLAFVSAQAGPRARQTVKRLQAKGLSWSSVSTVSSKGETVGVWQAHADHDLAEGTISAELSRKSDQAQLTVVAFEPGATAGAVTRRSGKRGAPRLSIDASAGGQVWAVGHLAGASRLQPAAGSQVVEQTHSARPSSIAWVQQRAATENGPVTVGGRARHSGAWSLAAVAVDPPAAAGQIANGGGVSIDSGGLGGYRTFSYNAEGDRIGMTSDDGAASYAYNQAGQLTGISGGVSYGYDGDGLRTAKTAAGKSTAFTWDPSGSLPLLVEEGGTSFVYGPEGRPLEQISSGAATYLLADQQGSTRLLTDSSGDVVGTYAYDSWGVPRAHTGESTSLQYDGEQADPESGLIYLRARYYDPSTGQFLTPDPRFAFNSKPYLYASNNPIAFADPTGEVPWRLIGAGLALCAAGLEAAVNWYDDYQARHTGETCEAVQLGLDPSKKVKVCRQNSDQAPTNSGGNKTFSDPVD
jgi:RHS repeat-associated protein